MLSQKWKSFFAEYTNPALHNNVNQVYATQTVYPARENLFHAFDFFEPEQTRVVILGQDPYPQPGNAIGLAFAVPETQPVPSSLHNIFSELDLEFGPQNTPRSTNLHNWAQQGVLLLNTILTVQAGTPMSHSTLGWQSFTDFTIQKLSATNQNMVFLLWGNPSQAKAQLIDQTRHLIIRSTHPSGLSWGKLSDGNRKRPDSFWGSMQFQQCNQYLIQHGHNPIKW